MGILPKFMHEETLVTLRILCPPAPDRTHIMGGRGDDREIRSLCGTKELLSGLFRHPLYLHAQYAQLIHDIRDTGRYQSQILTADKHVGTFLQCGQFLQRRSFPGRILPVKEIIHIQGVQGHFLFLRQMPEGKRLMHIESEVESRPQRGRILKHDHVGYQIEQALTYPQGCRIIPTDMCFNLSLGSHFISQSIPSSGHGDQIGLEKSDILPEHFPQHMIRNVGPAKPGHIKTDPPLFKFMRANGKRRHESTHDAFDCIHRDRPDPEKSKDMIDPESIEITTHLSESTLPPIKPVLLHPWPLIRRESPVLAFNREIIRRRTRLHIEVEECRLHPCLDPMPVHANGNISLQDDAMTVGYIMCMTQLLM